jgi:hypothetical protein
MKKIVFAILILVLNGCATLAGSAGVNWRNQNPGKLPDYSNAKALAELAIKELLKDPDSALFKNWTPFFKTLYNYGLGAAGNYEPLWAICVQVNAKNSFGGYNGYTWYYVKFRNGVAVNDSLGIGEGEYDCTHGPVDPARLA